MVKNFGREMSESYIIPGSIAVGDGTPLDIRCICNTVADFKQFYMSTGFDIRHEGLITYEFADDKKRLMVYKGDDVWEPVGTGSIDLSSFVTMEEVKSMLEAKSDKADNIFVSDIPSTVEVGGIEKGFTTDGMDIKDLLFKLLHKYLAPRIAISATPNGGNFEKGISVNNIKVTATGYRESDRLVSLKIMQNSVLAASKDVTETGNSTLTYTVPTITENTTFSASVYDGTQTVNSGTIGYSFIYPLYIGYVDATVSNPTSANVKLMTKRIVAKSNQTYTYTVENKRMCIACPPNWSIKSIIDPNNFDITPGFATSDIDVDCLDGTKQKYKVYVSEPTSQTNFLVKFNI